MRIRTWAADCDSPWPSVFTATSWTPGMRSLIILLTALQPPPPTPTTCIGGRPSRCSLVVKRASFPPAEIVSGVSTPPVYLPARRYPYSGNRTLAQLPTRRSKPLKGSGGARRAREFLGPADPRRHACHLFRQQVEAAEVGGAAGKHDSGGDDVVLDRPLHLGDDDLEDLLGAGRGDLG